MLILSNEVSKLRLSSTGITVEYCDLATAKVRLTGMLGDIVEPVLLEIGFESVAELTCKAVNFYESNYNSYRIEAEGLGHRAEVTGFYCVKDSALLEQSSKLYDPHGRLGLKHFIVTANDSYCEVLATRYRINASS